MAEFNLALSGNPIPRQEPYVQTKHGSNPIELTEKDIEKSLQRLNGAVRFSFHYLDIEHELFNCGNTGSGWFISFMQTVREVSQLTYQEFVNQRNHYELHPNTISKIDVKINLPEFMLTQLDVLQQFRLSLSGGRVHGFFIGNTFYVLWLDPEHNLKPDDRHGGRKPYPPILTPYDEALMKMDFAETAWQKSKEELAAFIEQFDNQCDNCPRESQSS